MQVLGKAGCKKIFREKVSGTSRERPEFQRILDQLRNVRGKCLRTMSLRSFNLFA
jgi:DNA invertase Pin-like site-specific DNA recombinase